MVATSARREVPGNITLGTHSYTGGVAHYKVTWNFIFPEIKRADESFKAYSLNLM